MKYLYLLILFYLNLTGFSQTIGIQSFATGFTSPVEITNAGDARLFVVEQGGKIKIVSPSGTISTTPFLNLTTSTISTGGERGLLGLAFHPNYLINGFFYVNYTNTIGSTVIARYSVNVSNPNIANAASANILLTIPQPYSNHNGGTIKFGPDGFLYIGMGDGGSAGDPENRSQNKNLLLGKMLRIDVNGASPYGIPPTNPYVGIAGADEIWAIGMRNPWKFSFDNPEGNLWIADVGQYEMEEINKVSNAAAGLNYGWKCYEGSSVFTQNCAVTGTSYTFPFAQYNHDNGFCSITGGYVYRGSLYPNFQGKYFFADYCVNKIGTVDTNGIISYSANLPGNNNYSTFGLDINNELYVASLSNGVVYKLVDTSLSTREFNSSYVQIYPNPAKTSFFIKSKETNFPINVAVFDISGKQLAIATLKSEENKIDISQLQKGLYLVNFINKNGENHNEKLIIE